MERIERWIAEHPRGALVTVLVTWVPNFVEPWWSLIVGKPIPLLARDIPGIAFGAGDMIGVALPTVSFAALVFVLWTLFSGRDEQQRKIAREEALTAMGAFSSALGRSLAAGIAPSEEPQHVQTRDSDSQPEPKIPDERLVILLRRYAIPAYDRLLAFLKERFDRCFDRGGWPGLAARLARDEWVEQSKEARRAVEGCLEGGGDFETAFPAFYWEYNRLMALAFHFGRNYPSHVEAIAPPVQELLRDWVGADNAFMKEMLDLSAGINRQMLGQLPKDVEPRNLLKSLIADPRLRGEE